MTDDGGRSARYREGMATRRVVLGDDHVDRALQQTNGFDAPFQELITEAAWGHTWSRPGWTLRERSIVTIALLAGLGHDEELAMHVRATARTGASREDVCEALMHVAVYAGVPAANRAIRIAKDVFDKMPPDPAAGEQ
ncbi:MAG TPA: 4-carboxymuconolactone decarboxylase [Devosiaceae bacterium]|nr:4-carboxymuconolactone decarboxylase [Devosiaceae bacterium]